MTTKQPIVMIGDQFTKGSNYLPRVINASMRAGLRPGTVNDVWIKHDGWCDFYNGLGPCNCDPWVTVTRREPES